MGLTVHGDVPFGNVCDVEILESGGVSEVRFAADPHGGPECLWFCFRLERSGEVPPSLQLTLKHSVNMLGCEHAERMRPVVRRAHADWQRLGAPEVVELPDGPRLLSWTTDVPETFLDVAFCYPYGCGDVDALVHETGGCWKAEVIGVSQKGRPLVRLSNDLGGKGSDRPGLYLVARQHCGETPGSWVLDGFLRHVGTLGGAAPLVWAVPLANIDGVEQGDYGKDNFPYDLNRAWGSPPMRHETLVLQHDVERWKQRCRPVLGIDFHAPGGTEGDGIYAYLPDPDALPEKHKEASAWTAAVREDLGRPYAAEDFDRVARYKSRWETPGFARYLCETLNVCAFTVETPYAMVGELVLTREHYRETGSRIAKGVIRRISVLDGKRGSPGK